MRVVLGKIAKLEYNYKKISEKIHMCVYLIILMAMYYILRLFQSTQL